MKNRRIIIEVKKPDRLVNGPEHKGTGGNASESPLQQVEKYIKAERQRERLYLEDENIEDWPWIGIVTNSRKWWMWEWPPAGKGDIRTPRDAWQGTTLTPTNIGMLRSILHNHKVGKDWAPDDPTSLFIGHKETLQELYTKERGKPSLETMKELWLRQLRASGNAPTKDEDINELFIIHTLLITIAANITASIISKEKLNLGFATWINDTSWLKGVQDTIEQYDWQQGTSDILRALYMGMVDKKHRKIYGEYYTPDWLAELLCEKILDDTWIEACIKDHFKGKHAGILDPACGSGTFLFHAARRIVNSKPVQNSGMTPQEITEMLVQLINGIDIHPVAIEMARTNLLRSLPTSPTNGLRIWQGDSFQTDRKDAEQTGLFDEKDTLLIYSREKKRIRLPKSFLSRDAIVNDIQKLTETANTGKPFPVGLDNTLNKEDQIMLRDTHTEITNVCRDEGNSIWTWYILNKAGPYILANEKVSRIIANPPWVRLSNIQDVTRKNEIIEAAKSNNLWVGGKNATGFDIASLFVVKCRSLYLNKRGKSGWILPQAAIKGGN